MYRLPLAAFLAAAVTLFGLSSRSASAEAAPTSPTEPLSPKDWLEDRVRAAHKLAARKVEPDSNEERAWQDEAKTLIDDILDWEELTRRSLGSNWRKRSEKEQEAFGKLLRQLIEASYRSRLKYAVRENLEKPEDVDIDWIEEHVRSKKAELIAKVTTADESALLGFKLRFADGRWRVYDVAIDDLSTVRTYRSNFNKLIKKEGWEELMRRLRKKLEDIEAGRADFARPGGLSDEGEKAPRTKK